MWHVACSLAAGQGCLDLLGGILFSLEGSNLLLLSSLGGLCFIISVFASGSNLLGLCRELGLLLLHLGLKLHGSCFHLVGLLLRGGKFFLVSFILFVILRLHVGKDVTALRSEGRNEVDLTSGHHLVVDGEPLVDAHVDHERGDIYLDEADLIR